MDIKKIVRKILSEQPEDANVPNQTPAPQLTKAQRALFTRLIGNWRETFPEMTVEDALTIFTKYREVVPQIKDDSIQAVKSFLYRGNGKYTINDLRDGNVDIKDLLLFLLEFKKFRYAPGAEKVDPEVLRTDNIFKVRGEEITDEKIEASKSMWESQKNILIDDDGFRVYSVNTMDDAKRYGYYYQDELKKLVLYNIENNKTPRNVSPWCVFSRGNAQSVHAEINGKQQLIINSVGNLYRYYRQDSKYSFYLVFDESKDLFGADGPYRIATIMRTSHGRYLLASMYNGEYYVNEEDLIKRYPKLKDNLDKLEYKPFNPKVEVNSDVPLTILDIVNETEGSPNAFWMQGPDEKEAYINQGGYLKNPKSWETLSNDLRETYITSIVLANARQKIATEEFFRTIVDSGIGWKNKLNRRMVILGKSGIGYLADNFMQENYAPDFYGKKNSNVRIYKKNRTQFCGLYNIENGDWVEQDGITYTCEFTKRVLSRQEGGDIDDFVNDKIYTVDEYSSPFAKFYVLNDTDSRGKETFHVYIMSEKKYKELRAKLDGTEGTEEEKDIDVEKDTDMGEQTF